MYEDDDENLEIEAMQLTSTYLLKEDLHRSIHQTERLSLWGYILCIGMPALFSWRFDLAEGLATVSVLVGIIGAVVLSEVYRCKAMLLKSELREIQRYGEVPFDPELADIVRKRREKSHRWWPF